MSNPYVQLARQAIKSYLTHGQTIDCPSGLPAELTNKKAGTFVSLHNKDELRGCIGTFIATKPNIAQEIIDNAISAATRDFRFEPIKLAELDHLTIKVDVLSEPESIQGISSLDPKKYGVIVRSQISSATGLLLPDLPGIDDPGYQVAIARQKAGIGPTDPVYLYRFTVERYEED